MRNRYQTPLGSFFIVFLLTFLLVSQVKRAELPVGILKPLSPWFCSWLNGDEFQVEDKQLCLVNSRPCVEKNLSGFFFCKPVSGKIPHGAGGRVKSILERATSDDSENVIFYINSWKSKVSNKRCGVDCKERNSIPQNKTSLSSRKSWG